MNSDMTTGWELLTTDEMKRADQLAVEAGVPFLTLMENAGRAVADEAIKMVPIGAKITVLCGPGNNGGDGFVAARLLRERGYSVRVACTVPVDALQGDAAEMARRWGGEVDALLLPQVTDEEIDKPSSTAANFNDAPALIIDALLGSGIGRELNGPHKRVVQSINDARDQQKSLVLSIDVPTGLDGNSGTTPHAKPTRCNVVTADRTITFVRRKPGHMLSPGRDYCGHVVVADIGIPETVLRDMNCKNCANRPEFWLSDWPLLRSDAHKYTRGHAVVVSGPPENTGAARLGARGALRIGAGLVTVATPLASFPVNAVHLTAIMLKAFEVPGGLAKILEDKRLNAVLIGPGCSIGAATREMVEIVLRSDAAAVLDADALTSFVEAGRRLDDGQSFGYLRTREAPPAINAEMLFSAIKARGDKPVVLTPHEGEFKRLFGALPGSKLDRARVAAKLSGAVVILKGPDTVIASPDGRAAINENAPPWLATAGSGDVLAGYVVGLLAQGMPAYQAACAAVWLHGECARKFGPGLIAEDLPEMLPHVLPDLMP